MSDTSGVSSDHHLGVERVVVLGRGGAGKSTASIRLGQISGLPVTEGGQAVPAAGPVTNTEAGEDPDPADLGRVQSVDHGLGTWVPTTHPVPGSAEPDTVLILDHGWPGAPGAPPARTRERADLWRCLLTWYHHLGLTRRSREEFRLTRWRTGMNDHVVVLGFGTRGPQRGTGAGAEGTSHERIVIVDRDTSSVAEATGAGHVAICGSAASESVLREALVDRAGQVIVALDRDDAAILAALMLRRLSPKATMIASAREAENALRPMS